MNRVRKPRPRSIWIDHLSRRNIRYIKRKPKRSGSSSQFQYSSVYTRILQNQWKYLQRTLENVGDLLKHSEEEIRNFVEVVTGRTNMSDMDRDITALPIRYGGLGIPNPSLQCQQQYRDSDYLTEKLQGSIMSGDAYQFDHDTKLKIRKQTAAIHKLSYEEVLRKADEKTKRHMQLLQAKETSTWLTSLPSKQQGMYFNREEFKDAIQLRYGWTINDLPRFCECGKENSNDHALTCQLGGFVILRHNAIRNLEAELLSNVCKDVEIEPVLIPLNSGDILSDAAYTDENARLDVSCRSFWRPLLKSFFDVRVTHPNCASHMNEPQKTILKQNETIKKIQYNVCS